MVREPLSLDTWYFNARKARTIVRTLLPTLPPADKYDDTTWEYTVARDVQMQNVDYGTHLLDEVMSATGNKSLALLIEAAKPLQFTFTHEPSAFYSSSLLKNLGLAYATMVRSEEEFEDLNLTEEPFSEEVGKTDHGKTISYVMNFMCC